MSRPGSLSAGGVIALAGGSLFAGSLVFGLIVYATRFGETPPPWSIARAVSAILWNAGGFALFGLHHSVFARPSVRDVVARAVTPALERSSYVWVASLLFLAVLVFWATVPGVAWQAPALLAPVLYGLQIAGVLFTGYASHQLGLLDLAGIRQAFGRKRPPRGPLTHHGAYGFVRHPIYLAWLLMVWPAPFMTGSRLLFALVTTCYLVIAVPFEERSLRRDFGTAYDDYARHVRWRMVPGVY